MCQPKGNTRIIAKCAGNCMYLGSSAMESSFQGAASFDDGDARLESLLAESVAQIDDPIFHASHSQRRQDVHDANGSRRTSGPRRGAWNRNSGRVVHDTVKGLPTAEGSS